jgi:hypothetical protein
LKVTSRADAIAKGSTRYFTGKPCRRGHIAPRSVASRCCAVCGAAKARVARALDPTKSRAASVRWWRAHRDEFRATNRVASSTYRRNNRAKVNALKRAYQAKRKARKLAQACACCAPEHFKVFYDTDWLGHFEVDHRIALALGGKHCAKNLQVLTPEQHKAKTAADRKEIARRKRNAAP